jgi:hypothetical protein
MIRSEQGATGLPDPMQKGKSARAHWLEFFRTDPLEDWRSRYPGLEVD